jgi:hypothetical protein
VNDHDFIVVGPTGCGASGVPFRTTGYRDSIENKSCAFFTYRDSQVTPLADSQFSCELYPSEARAVSFSDSVTITSGDTECCIDEVRAIYILLTGNSLVTLHHDHYDQLDKRLQLGSRMVLYNNTDLEWPNIHNYHA